MTQKENVLNLIAAFHKKFQEKVTKDLTKAGFIVKDFKTPYPGSMDFGGASVSVTYNSKDFQLKFTHSGMGFIIESFGPNNKPTYSQKSFQSVESLVKFINKNFK